VEVALVSWSAERRNRIPVVDGNQAPVGLLRRISLSFIISFVWYGRPLWGLRQQVKCRSGFIAEALYDLDGWLFLGIAIFKTDGRSYPLLPYRISRYLVTYQSTTGHEVC